MWSIKLSTRELISLILSPGVIPIIYLPNEEKLEVSIFVTMAIASYGGIFVVGLQKLADSHKL